MAMTLIKRTAIEGLVRVLDAIVMGSVGEACVEIRIFECAIDGPTKLMIVESTA